MFLLHDEELNWETFDKYINYFEISIEFVTNLRVTYKNRDQFSGLILNLKKKMLTTLVFKHYF